jgi:hypothetical protein
MEAASKNAKEKVSANISFCSNTHKTIFRVESHG